MYQVALCEDEKIFCETQEKICRDILEKMAIEYNVTTFENSRDFLAAFSLKQKRFDLILLDIVMDGINGMELARKIRETDKEAVIIFITANREFALEGYDVNALHYLMKPLDADLLERLINKAYKDKYQNNFYILKSGAANQRIAVKDIIALETRGRKVEITLPDKTLYYSGKLTEILEELPKNGFVRCHQAFAVNINNIREFSRSGAIAVNGQRIPVSRAYIKDVKMAFLKNIEV